MPLVENNSQLADKNCKEFCCTFKKGKKLPSFGLSISYQTFKAEPSVSIEAGAH